MAEFLGEKPSSRVLRPPGGQTSGIFGGNDDLSPSKKTANAKPTFQSSVFNTEPEPVKPRTAGRTDRMSSNIFGTEPDSNSTGSKKTSKTHQSSVFQEPEPLSEDKCKAIAVHRISNVPMFSTSGVEESRRPLRRPITAPAQMPSCLNLSSESNYATENKPAAGERTKFRTGYKPANQNLSSSVFNLQTQTEVKRKEKRHYVAGAVKPVLLALPAKPRIRTRPVHRNEVSSVFLSESDVAEIKNECQKRPMNVTLDGIFGPQKHELNEKCKEGRPTSCKTANDTYQSKVFDSAVEGDVGSVYSADDRMSCLMRQKTSTKKPSVLKDGIPSKEESSPLWSTSDHGVVRCTHRAQAPGSKTTQSSLFSEDSEDDPPRLWSSDFNMSSRKPNTCHTSSNTFKSTVFGTECKNVNPSPPKSTNVHVGGTSVTHLSESLNDEVELISKDFAESVIVESALQSEAASSSFSDSEIRLQ